METCALARAAGWCTLERPDRTVVTHVPDPSHPTSLFFLDVVTGHATDWYLATLPTPGGHALRVEALRVVDVFGDVWPRRPRSWRSPLDTRSTLFRTAGWGPHDLLVWSAATPLVGDVVEQVLLGVDEDADVLWVVQEVRDGRAVPSPDRDGPAAPDPADATVLRYTVAPPGPGAWYPYPLTDASRQGLRRFRQGRLVVAGLDGALVVAPPPPQEAELLRATPGSVHEIEPAQVSARGVRVERRWLLCRRVDGAPVLWQQRRRTAPHAPPAMPLAFDRTTPAGPGTPPP